MSDRQAELTLRVGLWDMAERARADTVMDRLPEQTILLVHGFNSSEPKAARALGQLRQMLAEKHGPLRERTFRVAWTGDFLGPLGYPMMVGNAAKTSGALLQYLLDKYPARTPGDPPPSKDLVLVAHSLGCRMVLEMLRTMHAQPGRLRPGLRKLTVILMAAAVPVWWVERQSATALGPINELHVLFSSSDEILSTVFIPGELAAPEGLRHGLPQAVGLKGNPSARWVSVNRHEMRGFRHGDYLKRYEAADEICTILGIAHRRSTPTHAIPPAAPLAGRWPFIRPLLPTTSPRPRTLPNDGDDRRG